MVSHSCHGGYARHPDVRRGGWSWHSRRSRSVTSLGHDWWLILLYLYSRNQSSSLSSTLPLGTGSGDGGRWWWTERTPRKGSTHRGGRNRTPRGRRPPTSRDRRRTTSSPRPPSRRSHRVRDPKDGHARLLKKGWRGYASSSDRCHRYRTMSRTRYPRSDLYNISQNVSSYLTRKIPLFVFLSLYHFLVSLPQV